MSRNPQQNPAGAQPANRGHTHSAPPNTPMQGAQYPPYGYVPQFPTPYGYPQQFQAQYMRQPMQPQPSQIRPPHKPAYGAPQAASAQTAAQPRPRTKKKKRAGLAIIDPETRKPIDIPQPAEPAPVTAAAAPVASAAPATTTAAPATTTAAAHTTKSASSSGPGKVSEPAAALNDKEKAPRSKNPLVIKTPSGDTVTPTSAIHKKIPTTASAPATPISGNPPQVLEIEKDTSSKKEEVSVKEEETKTNEDKPKETAASSSSTDAPAPRDIPSSEHSREVELTRKAVEYPLGTYNPKTATKDSKRTYPRSFLMLFQNVVTWPAPGLDISTNKQVKAVQKQNNKKKSSGGGGVVPAFLSTNSDFAAGKKIKSTGMSIKRPNFDVKPLEKSDNRWKPATLDATVQETLDENEAALKKARGILNRLTLDKFDKLSAQLISIGKDLPETMVNSFVEEVFKKAIDEPFFSRMYAQLCASMSADSAVPNFKKFLLNNCQKEFEKDREAETEKAAKESAKAEVSKDSDEKKDEKAEKLAQEEEEYRQLRAKLHMLGNIKFIGELYLCKMVSEMIIYKHCIDPLLAEGQKTGDEEVVECLCQLFETAGSKLEPNPQQKPLLQDRFDTLKKMADPKAAKKLSSRIRFRIQDVTELRIRGWKARREQAGPKTIKEVHKEAAKAKAAAAQSSMNDRNQRGGHQNDYRNNRDRNNNNNRQSNRRSNQSHNNSTDGWSQVPAKVMAQKIDRNKLGIKSSSNNTHTVFKPSWSFGASSGKKEEPKGTPKKTPQTRNMNNNSFALLGGDDDKEEEGSEEEEEEEVEVAEELTEDEQKKVRGIFDEYIGTGNAQEAIECLQTFNPDGSDAPITKPSAYFVDYAITKSLEESVKKCDLVAQLFAKMFELKLVTADLFVQGIEGPLELLEDILIDAPKASDIFGALFAKAMAVGEVPLSALNCEQVTRMFGDTALKLVLKTLKSLEKELSQQQVVSAVTKLGFPLRDFLPQDRRTDGTFEDQLDRNSLKYLDVPAAAPSSGSGMYTQLLAAVKEGDAAVESWVTTNVQKDKIEGSFVADLAKAIVAHVVTQVFGENLSRAPKEAEKEKEQTLFKSFKSVLHKYSHWGSDDHDLTVHVLNGVQAYAADNEFPNGLLYRWFSTLYEEDIVEEDGFQKWKKTVDKGTLAQLDSFFKNLDEGEVETDA